MELAKVTRITQAEAEKAILEGKLTARLQRENDRLQQANNELGVKLTKADARLRMAENTVRREHRQMAKRYEARMRNRENEQIQMRGNMIDCFIIGFGFGAIVTVGILSWITTYIL